MLAERLIRRRTERMFAAFEAKDVEGMLGPLGPDYEMEFPAGLPVAGRWRGDQLRDVMRSIMTGNARLETQLHEVVVDRPWSPLGRMRLYVLWAVTETRPDGHRVTTEAVSVTEARRWRPVRSTELYADVPGLAEHLAPMVPPAVPAGREEA